MYDIFLFPHLCIPPIPSFRTRKSSTTPFFFFFTRTIYAIPKTLSPASLFHPQLHHPLTPSPFNLKPSLLPHVNPYSNVATAEIKRIFIALNGLLSSFKRHVFRFLFGICEIHTMFGVQLSSILSAATTSILLPA